MAVPSGGTTPPPPKVTLSASAAQVTFDRSSIDEAPDWTYGFLATANNGNFEVRVRRADYGDPIIPTVYVNGVRTTRLDPSVLDGFKGFASAITLHVTDANNNVVTDTRVSWCPNGVGAKRVNTTGPSQRVYPDSCDGGGGPWIKGTAWGVERGWARSASQYFLNPPDPNAPPGPHILDGVYNVRAKWSTAFASVFGFSTATVTMKLRIRTQALGGLSQGASLSTNGSETGLAKTTEVPTLSNPDPNSAPDLAALPAWGMSISSDDGKDYLTFGATVWNAGPAPMIVEGFRRPGQAIMDAYEYFVRYGKRVGRKKVGTMEYDPRVGHQHWHFHDFATYELLDQNQTNPVVSGKEAFCLANTDVVDLLVHNAKWRRAIDDLGSVCGGATSTFVREALSVGYGDTYSQFRPGQAFDITNVPNGTYYIRVTANPLHRLVEHDTTNNMSLRQIILTGAPGSREVEVPPYNGIDTEAFPPPS